MLRSISLKLNIIKQQLFWKIVRVSLNINMSFNIILIIWHYKLWEMFEGYVFLDENDEEYYDAEVSS